MAQAAPATRRVDSTPTLDATLAGGASAQSTSAATHAAPNDEDKDKVLPLPGWLVKVYFIFPVVLYIPDAIFNYYVYSDGGTAHNANPVLQAGFVVLWGFLAIGVVGMAYLLSVLAPWHWGQGHHVQAFFCAMGVVIATAITTWCSLAFRSQDFKAFPTDQWVYSVWPKLRASNFSLTMLLVAIAPPFWGLFWAVVQPTTRRRSLAQMQMSHEERLLRTQQEAELKQIKAETNARVREAQLRGMAATAAAARKQAAQLITRKEGTQDQQEATSDANAAPAALNVVGAADAPTLPSSGGHEYADRDAAHVLQLPSLNGSHSAAHGGDMSIMNHATPSAAAVLSSDVEGSMGTPVSDTLTFAPRRPPMLGATLTPAINPMDMSDDGMTGTTGPRPAVRRSMQSSLLSAMNGPNPAHVQVVTEAMNQLNIPLNKRTLTANQARQLVPLVAEKLDSDETFARAVIGRVMKSEAHRNS